MQSGLHCWCRAVASAAASSCSLHARVMKGIAYEGVLRLRGVSWAGGQGGRRVSVGALPGKEGEAQELIRSPRPTLCSSIKTICGANTERDCFFSIAGGAQTLPPKQCIICKHLDVQTYPWHDQKGSVTPVFTIGGT